MKMKKLMILLLMAVCVLGLSGCTHSMATFMAESYNDPEFLSEMRYYHKLREKLMPYILKTAKECVAGSKPMMRPLVYTYPTDKRAVLCEDEYLFGDELLVAPLLTENASYRRVYLPCGSWISLFTGKKYDGKNEYTVDANGRIPVFYKENHSEEIEKFVRSV